MKCTHCPLANSDRPCIALTRNHRRYCELIDPTNVSYHPRYREIILGSTDSPASSRTNGKPALPAFNQWRYVTTAELTADTLSLIKVLPPDIDLIIAIPRSGLLPGSLLAYHLHVPLLTVSRQRGIIDPGHGVRLESRPTTTPRHILLVDDTAASGNEMTANFPTVRAAYPDARITRTVIYCRPEATHAVDVFSRLYPGLHYLEWNVFNAGHGSAAGFDFDGILCRDFTVDECRVEASYRAAMATIEPLNLPRRSMIPLIVTARPESTRSITMEWLDRHGIKVDVLIMRDWPSDDPLNPPPDQSAAWKANHYTRSGLPLFIESDPGQAEIIAALSGKTVLCPALGRVIPPSRTREEKLAAAIELCDFRRSTCNCLGKPAQCLQAGYAATVMRADCERCLTSAD
jgi:hypothetical protein